ncbi:hypothetical protein Nepgr_022867 [Nepenthes gracilis]|uniref:Uncharacterized protein n=1 Tax=Nepenthes gracilis TaxID=150966 RepID=A0AAD3T1G6_NEPGR|nr:hypothetical protein Nepgr_022867 [Nepenthes gracilis]
MRSFPLMLLGVMYSSPHGGNLMLIHLQSADVPPSSREADGMFDHDVGVLLIIAGACPSYSGPLRSLLCGSCRSWIVFGCKWVLSLDFLKEENRLDPG